MAFTIVSADAEPLVSVLSLSLAEQFAEQAGLGATVRVVCDKNGSSWRVWTEGREYPENMNYAYHLYLKEMKILRRWRMEYASYSHWGMIKTRY